MRKVAVIGTASSCGKTTVGRRLAERLGVPFVELDALHHGPGWTEATADELRARVEPILATDGWVIDGGYIGKIGTIVQDAAETVVWLDLPRRVWLPRLIRRTTVRVVRREELWNGNRESFRTALLGRDGLILFSLRQVRRRREEYPKRFASRNLVRLRSQKEVDRWLATFD
jgi:adenylate kinase family enzyme